MLGCAAVGGFYSVIDVRQPEGRVRSILEALDPCVIVCDESTRADAHSIAATGAWRVANLDEICAYEGDADAVDTARGAVCDVDPLYVNFTSGSTGTPKGVVVARRSVTDFIPVFCHTFSISEDDVVANQAPFDFDVSVKDIYSCLLTGATLVLVPRDYFSNPTLLMDLLSDTGATTLTWAVSALCFVSIMGGLDYRVPTTVRRVLFSGEVMPPKQLAVWQRHLPDATYVNLFGPTEICCNCTYHVVERVYGPTEQIPMGIPFENERVFLLDEHDHLVEEAGVEGEVCVAGTCVALGYLGDPDRTARSFTQNPLMPRWQETIYRTGDLAYRREDGKLVYASRKDNQIKHLGQRIELGDIEAQAQAVEGVERAVCLYDANRKRLVLCYVGGVDRKELKGRLRELLPSYMVPNNTRQVDAMPLTKNGKVDRAELARIARISSTR
jgi:amino acid adenylation domain-containing protein